MIARERESHSAKRLLRLNLNEVPYKIPVSCNSFSGESVSSYSSLSEAIIRSEIADDLKLDAANVMITRGADGGLDLLMYNLRTQLNRVFIPRDSYEGFTFLAEKYRWKIMFYDYQEMSSVLGSVTTKDLVILCNPVNPTGQVLSGIDDDLPACRGHIIFDEAYIEFATGASPLGVFGVRENWYFVRTFSKAFAAPGLRVGYVMGDAKDLERLSQQQLPYQVPTISVDVAIEFYRHKKVMQNLVSQTKMRTRHLLDRVRALGFNCIDSETYFFCIIFDSSEWAWHFQSYLQTKGIEVKAVGTTGLIRITCPKPEDEVYFLSVLESFRHDGCRGRD